MEGLLVLEGHCVTFWLGQDTETGGTYGAHGPDTEAATREDGNPSRHILRGSPWECEIQVDHCGCLGPTPRGQPVRVKNLRRGTFWPGWGDRVGTGLLGPSLVAALRGAA